MTDYLIKFALIHLLLTGAYYLLLGRETQLGLLRAYLLGATLLALVLPLFILPAPEPLPTLPVDLTAPTLFLKGVAAGSGQQALPSVNWLWVGYMAGCTLMALRLAVGLFRIYRLYRQSRPAMMAGYPVRHAPGLDNSFSFFGLVFIGSSQAGNARDILLHEAAHVRYRHSYDLLLVNLLLVFFWWVPSLWLILQELRQIHEFQADAYVLHRSNYKSYLNLLINNTLGYNRIALGHSFSDTPTGKRLAYIKKLKRQVSSWKLAASTAIAGLTIYMFACQPAGTEGDAPGPVEDDTVFEVVDESASFKGGTEAFYQLVTDQLAYPSEALELGIEGTVFVSFIVNQDGSLSEVKVLRGIHPACDQEALRVVKAISGWLPARQGNRAVRQRLVLPIRFRLDSGSSATGHTPAAGIPSGNNHEADYEVHKKVDEPVSYRNGLDAFYNYVEENFRYPAAAREQGIEGVVYVSFVVKPDGSLDQVKLMRGIHPDCDEEALRLIKGSSGWQPARLNGRAVAQQVVLPIKFSLKP